MNCVAKIVLLMSFVFGGITVVGAQCIYDNNGRELTNKQRKKVKADEPVMLAIEHGDIPALKAALRKGVDVNARDCESGTTALILTIIKDNPEMMRLLISKKANVNLQNNSGFTALMYAVGWGRVEIVKELMAAGADLNKRTFDGDKVTALGIALRYSANQEMQELVKILKANGGKQ